MNSLPKSQWTLGEIAALVGGVVIGEPQTLITGVAGVDDSETGDLVFAESPAFLARALESAATAVLTAECPPPPSVKPLIQVDEPRLAFVRFLEALAPAIELPEGIHSSAQIGHGLSLGTDVRIGAHVTLGDAVTLGDGVRLFPGVYVGDGCVVGAGTVLSPNVVLYRGVRVGQGCLIHAGTVLGSDGFGFLPVGGRLRKVPHLGGVEIGDDVEIGSNTCIDRAKTGMTTIGSGTKIDNLVHIAHNVQVGPSCVLAGQVGIAGSSTLGAGVMLGGQVGIKDHLHVHDGVQVGAQSGMMKNPPAGETIMFGSPAIPMRQKLKELAATSKMPDTLKRISAMERRLAELERRLEATASTEAR
ncbi:MAG: UDP-3-O-[3-hydroxymyristoyl] glucosamine N-acyltransferase [Chthonomonadaceae bacterium]|nr:UDP-3-O-[3-hydroxymyristoyl] glucosamine N-acyltransferase [Chthonomonadaceae bacterium]